MDRVGFEPTTSAPWQLSRLLLFYLLCKWQQSYGKRTVLFKSHPLHFFFAWSVALYHEGALRKGIVDYEVLIVKH
jgi:hypothetical protein